MLLASLTPDRFVLRADPGRDEALVHALGRPGPAPDPRWPCCSTASAFNSVDFPQPEGPTMETNSPGRTVSEVSETASTAPSMVS